MGSGSCCSFFLSSSWQSQGRAAIPAAAAEHLCQDLCPPRNMAVQEPVSTETLGHALPWAKSPWEGSAEVPVGADARSALVNLASTPLQEAAGSSASAPEVPTATSAERGGP